MSPSVGANVALLCFAVAAATDSIRVARMRSAYLCDRTTMSTTHCADRIGPSVRFGSVSTRLRVQFALLRYSITRLHSLPFHSFVCSPARSIDLFRSHRFDESLTCNDDDDDGAEAILLFARLLTKSVRQQTFEYLLFRARALVTIGLDLRSNTRTP